MTGPTYDTVAVNEKFHPIIIKSLISFKSWLCCTNLFSLFNLKKIVHVTRTILNNIA